MTESTPTASTDSGSVAAIGRCKRMERSELVALLGAAVEFRRRTGSAPTASSMAGFLESSAPLPSHLSASQMFNKLRHLRHRHNHSLPSSSPEDRLIKKLCSQVWGSSPVPIDPQEEDDNDDGEDDGNGDENGDDGDGDETVDDGIPVALEEYPYVLEAVEKYYRQKGLNIGLLKGSLGVVKSSRLVALEEKWRRHWSSKMMIVKKRLELSKELLRLLAAAEKGSG